MVKLSGANGLPPTRRGLTIREVIGAKMAMNLSWPYYLIQGTNDIRKIGRQLSSGCIGLFNEHVVEIFDRARIGTPVLLI